MTTAQWIFDRAMGLMDTGDEVSGAKDIGANRPYKHRTLDILNVLGRECVQYCWGMTWQELTGFDQPVGADDELAQGVLPYGLASHLFLEEDPAAANFFQQRYEELLERWRRRQAAQWESLEPPYGGIEGRRSSWR